MMEAAYTNGVVYSHIEHILCIMDSMSVDCLDETSRNVFALLLAASATLQEPVQAAAVDGV